MAARKLKIHQTPETIERIKGQIQACQIAKRLNDHVMLGLELNKSQVSAALGLLKKVVPDLASMQHSGDANNPIKIEAELEIRPQLSRAEWEKRHVLKK